MRSIIVYFCVSSSVSLCFLFCLLARRHTPRPTPCGRERRAPSNVTLRCMPRLICAALRNKCSITGPTHLVGYHVKSQYHFPLHGLCRMWKLILRQPNSLPDKSSMTRDSTSYSPSAIYEGICMLSNDGMKNSMLFTLYICWRMRLAQLQGSPYSSSQKGQPYSDVYWDNW